MKNITKIILIFAFTIFNIQSFAQIYGLKAGLNLSTIKRNYIDYPSIIPGIMFGGTVELQFGEIYSVETGLVFNNKGKNFLIGGDDNDTVSRTVYLDIPINFKYRFKLKEKPFYVSMGPYIGFGIGGSHLTKKNGELYGHKIKWGNDALEHDFKRFDYGINLGAGIEFGAIGVGLQYGIGLANIKPSGDLDNSMRNRLLSLLVAYKFSK